MFITTFSVSGIVHAINLVDGFNGLACGITLGALLSFLFVSFQLQDQMIFLISLSLIGTILGFFVLNYPFGKIFLGDGGVYLLGIILSVSLIYEHNVKNNIIYADEIFFLLLLPGFDLVRLTITRSLNLKNPFMGDRNHIHHLLINKFSLIFSNSILFFLSISPIFLFIFLKLNFFLIFLIFIMTYFFLILFLKSSDKK